MIRYVLVDANEAKWAMPFNTLEEARDHVKKKVMQFLLRNYPALLRTNPILYLTGTLEQVYDAACIAGLDGEILILTDGEDLYQLIGEASAEFQMMMISEEGDQGVYMAFDSGSRSAFVGAYTGQTEEEIMSDSDTIYFDTNNTPTGGVWRTPQ